MKARHLGKSSALPTSPAEAVLDYVPNPRAGALPISCASQRPNSRLYVRSRQQTSRIGDRLRAGRDRREQELKLFGYSATIAASMKM